MVKLNILGSIIILMALSGLFIYHSQSSKADNFERSQVSLNQNMVQNAQTERVAQLQKQLEDLESKNTQLLEENLNLLKQNTELNTEKSKLEESKIQIEEANTKITEELTTLKETVSQRRRRGDTTGSPYRVSPDSTNENRGRDRGRQGFREMMSIQNISKITTLTEEQKEFFKALREEFKEFQIRMIRNEDTLSREEVRTAWGEQMTSYRESVFSNLTPEQVEELNKITDDQIKEREQSFNRERE